MFVWVAVSVFLLLLCGVTWSPRAFRRRTCRWWTALQRCVLCSNKKVVNVLGRLVTKLRQWWCGACRPGHHYTVSMIAGEETQTYVLDPMSLCKRCSRPLGPQQYARLIYEISLMDELS